MQTRNNNARTYENKEKSGIEYSNGYDKEVSDFYN